MVLYDFAAAFPSIAGRYKMAALTAFGAPQMVFTTMQNYYHHNNLHI